MRFCLLSLYPNVDMQLFQKAAIVATPTLNGGNVAEVQLSVTLFSLSSFFPYLTLLFVRFTLEKHFLLLSHLSSTFSLHLGHTLKVRMKLVQHQFTLLQE
jgi:hypothetical protein